MLKADVCRLTTSEARPCSAPSPGVALPHWWLPSSLCIQGHSTAASIQEADRIVESHCLLKGTQACICSNLTSLLVCMLTFSCSALSSLSRSRCCSWNSALFKVNVSMVLPRADLKHQMSFANEQPAAPLSPSLPTQLSVENQ